MNNNQTDVKELQSSTLRVVPVEGESGTTAKVRSLSHISGKQANDHLSNIDGYTPDGSNHGNLWWMM